VRGSALLVGGDPGIGKSTLLMQAAAALAQKNAGRLCLRRRGRRADAAARRAARRQPTPRCHRGRNQSRGHSGDAGRTAQPDLVILDSIQTLWSDAAVDSAPGTVTQVRAAPRQMIRYAKRPARAMILVGHVTKDGQIAGPRGRAHGRCGAVFRRRRRSSLPRPAHGEEPLRRDRRDRRLRDDVGGLREVSNPSELFLGERNESAPGAAVFAGMEGTRPVLVEIQALVAPRRSARRAVPSSAGIRRACR
jgi:DNA repair protein RadA/Sms